MQVIDYDMPYEQFLTIFEDMCAEWVDGVVYQLPRRSSEHQRTATSLHQLLDIYFKIKQSGHVITAPTVMRINDMSAARCPDLQILLGQNMALKHEREIAGAPDIVVEIISEPQHTLERGEKFIEYEAAGINEYWIIDPIRQEGLFYALHDRYYQRHNPDTRDIFHSHAMPDFHLPVELLWSNPSPSQDILKQVVHAMMNNSL